MKLRLRWRKRATSCDSAVDVTTRRDALHFGDVVVNARDDLTQFGARVKARRQFLQMPIERQPHVEEHIGRDRDIPIRREDIQNEANHSYHDHLHCNRDERLNATAQQRFVDQKLRDVRLS